MAHDPRTGKRLGVLVATSDVLCALRDKQGSSCRTRGRSDFYDIDAPGNVNALKVCGARENCPRDVRVTRPLGKMLAITGASVSVKSTLVGRNSRSNPATYVGFYDTIRDLFTAAPLSVEREYKAGRLCGACKGARLRIVGMKRRLGLHGNVVAHPAPPLFHALTV